MRFVGSDYRAVFDALGATTVVGLVLVATLGFRTRCGLAAHRPAHVRQHAAGPAGLLVASLPFIVVTGWGRGGGAIAGYERSSRTSYVVVALTVPALAVAIQALYSRLRWLGPALLVALLVGVPHNVMLDGGLPARACADGHDHTRSRASHPGPRRRTGGPVASPASLARAAPGDLQPYPGIAPDITVGWLRTADRNGKLPDPGVISDETRAFGELLLSVEQSDGSAATMDCITVTGARPARPREGRRPRHRWWGPSHGADVCPGHRDRRRESPLRPGSRFTVDRDPGPLDVVLSAEILQYPTSVCHAA